MTLATFASVTAPSASRALVMPPGATATVPAVVIGPPVRPAPVPTEVTVPPLLVSRSAAQAQAVPFHFRSWVDVQPFWPRSANPTAPSAIFAEVTASSVNLGVVMALLATLGVVTPRSARLKVVAVRSRPAPAL